MRSRIDSCGFKLVTGRILARRKKEEEKEEKEKEEKEKEKELRSHVTRLN